MFKLIKFLFISILILAVIAYVVSPIDFVPGPVDDTVVVITGFCIVAKTSG